MAIVKHQLTAGGLPVAGKDITVQLVVSGFDEANQLQVLGVPGPPVRTGRDGSYVLGLAPNDSLNPPGTSYRVTHPGGEVLAFVVPSRAAPADGWWLGDILVDDPELPGAVQVGVPLPAVGPTAVGQVLVVTSLNPLTLAWGSNGGMAGFTVTDLGNGLASVVATGSATFTDNGNGLATVSGGTVTDNGNGTALIA